MPSAVCHKRNLNRNRECIRKSVLRSHWIFLQDSLMEIQKYSIQNPRFTKHYVYKTLYTCYSLFPTKQKPYSKPLAIYLSFMNSVLCDLELQNLTSSEQEEMVTDTTLLSYHDMTELLFRIQKILSYSYRVNPRKFHW